MLAEFVHFYPGYTVKSALKEFSVTFYALLSAMYRIKAMELMDATRSRAFAQAGGEPLRNYTQELGRQAGGTHAILEEVKTLKEMRSHAGD